MAEDHNIDLDYEIAKQFVDEVFKQTNIQITSEDGRFLPYSFDVGFDVVREDTYSFDKAVVRGDTSSFCTIKILINGNVQLTQTNEANCSRPYETLIIIGSNLANPNLMTNIIQKLKSLQINNKKPSKAAKVTNFPEITIMYDII